MAGPDELYEGRAYQNIGSSSHDLYSQTGLDQLDDLGVRMLGDLGSSSTPEEILESD